MAINRENINEQLSLGIVIPCYNEESVIDALYTELKSFMEEAAYEVRVLFVDDGSYDRTPLLLKDICERDGRCAMLGLSRNFGHQAAVSAGLLHIKGDVVGVMDGDLQDPPAAFNGMLEKWMQGYEVVYGIRKNRKENVLLKGSYALFYRLLNRLANVDIPLDAGDFSLMDRRIVDTINKMPEHNRFVRGLRGWVGFDHTGYLYERSPRAGGTPKYNLKKLVQLAFDGIISMSSFPLRIASWLGGIAALLGIIYAVYALGQVFFFNHPPSGWTSLVMLIIFFGGVQLIVLGIIGEYLGRVFDEVKNRPQYVIQNSAGWISNNDSCEPKLKTSTSGSRKPD